MMSNSQAVLARAKNLYRVIDERASGRDLPLLSVSASRGVIRREEISEGPARADSLENYKVCDKDDIVLNRMSAYQGAVGRSSERGLVSPDYLVLRPSSLVHPNYMHFLFRSPWFVDQMSSRLRGIGSSGLSGGVRTPRINADDLGDIRVPLPTIEDQRRIAAFLDGEMRRVEDIRAVRIRQLEQLADRLTSRRDSLFKEFSGTRTVPLMHLTDSYRPIVYGIVQAGPHVDDGIPYIKTGDLPRINPESLSRTSLAIHRSYSRSVVRPGDIVMAMRASIGTAALIPESLGEANLTQGTARIAARRTVDKNWLLEALGCSDVLRQCHQEAVGATFRTLNIWSLRRVRMPSPSGVDQAAVAGRLATERESFFAMADSLRTQLRLLAERADGLLDEIITGKIDFSTARGAEV